MAQRILGLDIGATSARAVVVESLHRGWTVVAAARAPVAPPAADGSPPLRERQLDAVRTLLSENQLSFESALVSLPGASASHVVTLPFADPKRIQQTIGFEVEGQIPFDLAEVAWDWQPLQERDGKAELLVAVVKKEELASLLSGLAAAGIDPRAVVPPGPSYAALFGAGALAREPGAAPSQGVQALIDVGTTRTSLCIVNGDRCEAARTFPVGSGSPAASVARELRATIRAWRARVGAAMPIQRVLLAGEAGGVPGLPEALAQEVEGSFEPLALAASAAGPVTAEEAPRFALALSLALRGYLGARGGRLNLRRGDLAYTRDFEHVRGKVQRLAAWTGLVVLLAILSSGVKVFALSRHERLLDAALCYTTTKLVGKCYSNDELAVAALRGKGTPAASIPKNSAVDIFTELSLRAPPGITVRYDRIEITRDKLHLQGLTDAAENVDKVVSALRASTCFGDARSGGARKRASDGKFEFTVDSDITCDTGEKQAGRG